MEHIERICSLESELTLMSICSVRIPSRKWDIFEKLNFVTSVPEKHWGEFADYFCQAADKMEAAAEGSSQASG